MNGRGEESESPKLRRASAADAPALAELIRSTIRELGPRAYSAEQVAVWSLFPADFDAFCRDLDEGIGLVLETEERLAALSLLHPLDHIALLYTAAPFAGRGFATRLIAATELEARRLGASRLSTEASHLARPVFARCGFSIVRSEYVFRHNVPFKRFVMEKSLL